MLTLLVSADLWHYLNLLLHQASSFFAFHATLHAATGVHKSVQQCCGALETAAVQLCMQNVQGMMMA